MKDPRVRLVLDASAVAAWGRSVDLGETVAEVCDEGALFGVPAACLAEAAVAGVTDETIRLLVQHPACVVLPLAAEDWPELVAGVRVLGRLEFAVALLEADDRGGYVVTAEPGAYGDQDGPIIGI